MFARAARDNKSIIGQIIASIIQSIWTTMSFLLLPTIIIEDCGFGAAMKRVRAMHKGNLLLIGIGECGVRGVTGIIGFFWFLALFGVIYLSITALHGVAALVVALVVGGAMLSIYVAFSTYLRMAYYTCLYLWAADVEKAGAQAPAPLPLAIALGQRTAMAA